MKLRGIVFVISRVVVSRGMGGEGWVIGVFV